jgi:flavin reductase (DIM6/NTAB) family NADH-FMN oxidoreductase RutF
MNSLRNISEDAKLCHVLGRFPTGVTALCAVDRNTPVGMTASAFTAISLNPQLVSACIKHGSWTWQQLRTRERIGISFLGHGHGNLPLNPHQDLDDIRLSDSPCRNIA